MPKRQDSKSARVRELLSAGESAAAIAKQVGCTVGLVYNVKSRMGSARKQAGKRSPRRQPRSAAPSSGDLQAIIAAVQTSERERVKLRSVLERISALISEAL